MGSASFGYSYGYALFQKRRDSTSARGWTQHSFVIMSELLLVGFFYRLLHQVSQKKEAEESCEALLEQLHE